LRFLAGSEDCVSGAYSFTTFDLSPPTSESERVALVLMGF
jgi:hypothetical protein